MTLPRLPRQPKLIHQTLPGDIQERTPPGQFVTEKFPVLTVGPTPEIDLTKWRLQVYGLVERELDLNWQEFIGLPPITVTADFHCVTQWSRLNNTWEGVAFTTLVNIGKPLTTASHVMVYCYGDYSVNIDLKALMEDDVCSRTATMAKILILIMEDLFAWWFPNGMAGRAQNGFTAWSS